MCHGLLLGWAGTFCFCLERGVECPLWPSSASYPAGETDVRCVGAGPSLPGEAGQRGDAAGVCPRPALTKESFNRQGHRAEGQQDRGTRVTCFLQRLTHLIGVHGARPVYVDLTVNFLECARRLEKSRPEAKRAETGIRGSRGALIWPCPVARCLPFAAGGNQSHLCQLFPSRPCLGPHAMLVLEPRAWARTVFSGSP